MGRYSTSTYTYNMAYNICLLLQEINNIQTCLCFFINNIAKAFLIKKWPKYLNNLMRLFKNFAHNKLFLTST